MTQNTNIRGRTLSVQKIIVSGVEVTPDGMSAGSKNSMYVAIRGASGNSVIVDSLGRICQVDDFSGEIYENEHTMTTDATYCFESSEKQLKSGTVLISTHNALLGDITNQRYPKSAGTSMSIDFVDLSNLYFKNASAGQNTKINIIGVLI